MNYLNYYGLIIIPTNTKTNKMHSTTYVNLTGGSIMNIMECINTPVIKTVYTDCRFKVPRECVKHTYPETDRLICITTDSALDVPIYDTFHMKIEWEVLKIYRDKQVFQILLIDGELSRVQDKLKNMKCCIDNTAKI